MKTLQNNQFIIDYEKMQSINQSFSISDRLSIISINRPTTILYPTFTKLFFHIISNYYNTTSILADN